MGKVSKGGALMPDRQTQQARILSLLQANNGDWVPLPAILSLFIGSYTRRIHELRKVWDIEIQRNGHNSAYRLNGPKHQSLLADFQLHVDDGFIEATEGKISGGI